MSAATGHGQGVVGSLCSDDDLEWYRVDGLASMDPFLMTVSSNSDLWLFASSRGTLTAGRTDANGALIPYETEDRIHRAAGVTGPVTVIARTVDGARQIWRPFGPESSARTRRSVAKSTMGNRIRFEEHNPDWGVKFTTTWSPSDSFGWVRSVELTNDTDVGVDLEIVDGLIDVMPAGLDAGFERDMSNLADAYKRSETGRWGSSAIFTMEALASDSPMPGESLAATVIWAFGDLPTEIHLDERVVEAMLRGEVLPARGLLTGRRGSYLRRGPIEIPAGGSRAWSLVADSRLNHAQVVDRVEQAQSPKPSEAVHADIAAGTERLRVLLALADGFHRTGDPVADAHHLSNVTSNAMRGGLLIHGMMVPIADLLDHLDRWNQPTQKRHAKSIAALGESVSVEDLRAFALGSNDPDLIRLILEFIPLAFSRRHGDPSRPWNQFSINVRSESGEDVIGYEGNWRDIFQNWEALLLSFPEFIVHAVTKFVDASTADGNNPYRITQDGMDWEVPDPHDPWANLGYWGDHQVVYLHHLLKLWERFDPGDLDAWLERPVFVYADVPYDIADHDAMVRDPRSTITYNHERAARVDKRVANIGSDGKLLVTADSKIARVGLFEKLLVPSLAKLSAFVPGGGIWMNTQRPEWNDANNALAGYGLSMVTLYYLHGYLKTLLGVLERHPEGTISISKTTTEWLMELGDAFTRNDPQACSTNDQKRRSLLDELGAIGTRHRARASSSFDTAPADLAVDEVVESLSAALSHLAHTISLARTNDGLFASYNVVSFPTDDSASVGNLGPMLEGQVAIISSGALSSSESLEVIDALFSSDMYRPDQDSFMLYPVKQLPGFLDKNTIPGGHPLLGPLADQLIAANVLIQDHLGMLHFAPGMTNDDDVVTALDSIAIADGARTAVRSTYEQLFNHHAYTGRSGSMYGYEGIGSIFWHMVGKLLVGVQESYWRAVEGSEAPEVIDELRSAYLRVRAGLGFQKDPATFGAIPTDCYSCSPAHSGAQQPWMTGTVKEGIIARFGELGLRVADGCISMVPGLLDADELVGPSGTGEFSYCGVPFLVKFGQSESVELRRSGEWDVPRPGLTLDRPTSRSIFGRTAEVQAVRFTLLS